MDSFDWKDAPLTSFKIPLVTAIIYSLLCVLHRNFYGVNPPQSSLWKFVAFLVPYHNLFLSLISLIMFIGCSFALFYRTVETGSFDWFFCETSGTRSTGALGFWSYIYYLSKYYELLDTILQLMRGKYPPHYFLHAYHHALVLVMSWAWLEYSPSLRYGGLLFNVFVHVIMYYYFYLKSINIEPSWKRYVTTVQIIQFGTSGLLFLGTMSYVLRGEACQGMPYLYMQLIFNVTLLAGFLGVLGSSRKSRKEA
jgi:hypothetical protein